MRLRLFDVDVDGAYLLLSAWREIGEQLPGYNPQRHVVLVETGPRVRCAPREQAVLALVERSARKTLLLLSVQPQTPHITIVLIDGNLTGATLLGLPQA